MTLALIISVSAFFGIFILFLVLSKTLNNTVNHLVKLDYLLQKEFDLKKEHAVIEQLLKEEIKTAPEEESPEEENNKDKNQKTAAAVVSDRKNK
jgi:low affinity Fe/Cu permease